MLLVSIISFSCGSSAFEFWILLNVLFGESKYIAEGFFVYFFFIFCVFLLSATILRSQGVVALIFSFLCFTINFFYEHKKKQKMKLVFKWKNTKKVIISPKYNDMQSFSIGSSFVVVGSSLIFGYFIWVFCFWLFYQNGSWYNYSFCEIQSPEILWFYLFLSLTWFYLDWVNCY